MCNRTRTYAYLLATVVSSTALACGGGASSSSGPTGATATSPAAVAPPAAAATITGTVQAPGVAGAALGGVQAMSTGLRITVVGTGVTTTTDGSGHFTLSGVPAGSVQLRFEGPGIDARLNLDGLLSGQTLTITVLVSGSQATMTSERDDSDGGQHVDFSGKVESVGSGQLVVAGKKVVVNSSTRILGDKGATMTLTDVKVGARVEVDGTKQADGSVLATQIKLEQSDDGEGGGQQVELSGKVDSVGSGQLVVAGKKVTVNSATRITGDKGALVLADIKVGARVEVDGTKQADGSILASQIKLDD